MEIIATLFLLGVLLGIAIPRIDFQRYQINAGIQEVTSTLAAAQGNSVLRGHDVVLVFDGTDDLIQIHSDADSDGDLESSEASRVFELPEGLTFGRAAAPARPLSGDDVSFTNEQAGMPSLTFYRNGSTSEEGIIYVTTRRAVGSEDLPTDTRAIEVQRATGRVRCYSYATGAWQEGC